MDQSIYDAAPVIDPETRLAVSPRFLEIERAESLASIGLQQSELTHDMLLGRLDEIERDLTGLRREIDGTIGQGGQNQPGAPAHGNYPIGFCKQIRDQGLARLLNPGPADKGRPAFEAITAFRAAGGVFKGLWGIQKGRYFQNAIQAGSLWIDLGNDTVDRHRPPVEILPLEQAEFEEILDYDQYAAVARIYWGYETYPNLYFPALAAAFPVLLLRPGDHLRIPAPATLAPRNVRLAFDPARRFLAGSRATTQRLPSAVLDRLDTLAAQGDGLFAATTPGFSAFQRDAAPALALEWIDREISLRAAMGPESYFDRFAHQLGSRAAWIALR